MPLRKKLRTAFLGNSNNNDRRDDTFSHTSSVPASAPGQPFLAQLRRTMPQVRNEHSRRCHYCGNIVILPYEMDRGHEKYIPYSHHRSFRDLLNAADQGCDICAIFRDHLMSQGAARSLNNARVLLFTDEQLEWTSGSISVNEYSETTHLTVRLVGATVEGKATSLAAVKFGLFEQQGNSPNACVVGRPIASDPRSSQCFDLLGSWLHECSTGHTSCQQVKAAFFPNRIIDVGPADASQEPRLRLSKGKGLKEPYVALSHCWGGTQSLTTTTENINQRLKLIPVSSMPANFRDAVWVTRRLGLRYLWIDSLCIIQNSRADWELEAENMGTVYGNSFLTIAAAKAQDSSQGFLQRRPDSVTKPLATLSCTSGHGVKLPNLGLRTYPESWKRGVQESVLNGRGWTLQERMMPARIVHFGEQMLYWECHSATYSEGGLSPSETGFGNPSVFSKARLSDVWNEEQQGSFSDDLERWYACLDEYSNRNLTYPSDKLPAVAGLAKSMHDQVSQLDIYYAGIWKSDFVRGLLWRARKLGCLSQPSSYRAPSWSWAALDGEIKHDWYNLKYFDPTWWPTIEGISVRCKGRSVYSEIESAALRMKAPMRPAVYLGTPPSKGRNIIGPFDLPVQLADDPTQQWYDLWHFEPNSWDPVGPPLCRAYFDEPVEEGRLRPFALMCLGKFSAFLKPENWWEEKDWNCNFWALILEEVDTGSDSGILKRVGIASIKDRTAFTGWGALEKTIV